MSVCVYLCLTHGRQQQREPVRAALQAGVEAVQQALQAQQRHAGATLFPPGLLLHRPGDVRVAPHQHAGAAGPGGATHYLTGLVFFHLYIIHLYLGHMSITSISFNGVGGGLQC